MQDASANIVNYGSSDGIQSSTPSNINVDVTPRLYGRQILSGDIRGNQNITGVLTVINPTTNKPIIALDGTTGVIGIGTAASTTGNAPIQGIEVGGSNNSISLGVNQTNNEAELLFNDGTVNRLLVGQNSSGQQVVWITPPGTEVTTSTLQQRTFDSSASYVVLLQGDYTFPSFGSVPADTLNGGSYTTIAHNAGFIPNAVCFGPQWFPGAVVGTAPSGMPVSDTTLLPSSTGITQFTDVSGNAFFNFFYTVDSVNLYIGVTFQNGTSNPVTTLPLTIYYTVFALHATV